MINLENAYHSNIINKEVERLNNPLFIKRTTYSERVYLYLLFLQYEISEERLVFEYFTNTMRDLDKGDQYD